MGRVPHDQKSLPEESLAIVNFVELLVAFSDVLLSEVLFVFRGPLVKLLSNAIPSDPFSLTGDWLYVRAAIPDRRNKITISRLTMIISGSLHFKLKCASLSLRCPRMRNGYPETLNIDKYQIEKKIGIESFLRKRAIFQKGLDPIGIHIRKNHIALNITQTSSQVVVVRRVAVWQSRCSQPRIIGRGGHSEIG